MPRVRERFVGGDGDRLTAAQVDAVTDAALRVQADRAVLWDAGWGDWVEHVRKDKKVSDARWSRYARQAAPAMVLKARPRVAADAASLPAKLQMSVSRVGAGGVFVLRGAETESRLDEGGWLEQPGGIFTTSMSPSGRGSFGVGIALDANRPRLRPGPHRAAVRVSLRILEGGGEDAPVAAEWTEERAADFVLLPPGEPSAAPASDPTVGSAVLA